MIVKKDEIWPKQFADGLWDWVLIRNVLDVSLRSRHLASDPGLVCAKLVGIFALERRIKGFDDGYVDIDVM